MPEADRSYDLQDPGQDRPACNQQNHDEGRQFRPDESDHGGSNAYWALQKESSPAR